MEITLNIAAGSAAELQEAIAGLAGIVGGTAAPAPAAPKEDKPKRASRAAAQPEKQPEQAPTPEPEAEPDTTEGDGGGEDIPTVVDLRAAAQEKGKTPEGKKAIKALLDKYGSKSISEVPEELRTEFLAELNAL